jgi:hypothetical protein
MLTQYEFAITQVRYTAAAMNEIPAFRPESEIVTVSG